MPRAVNWIVRRLLTALGLSAAIILASCGEEIIAPNVEHFSVGAPLADFSSVFDQYQFLGFVLDDQGANDTPAQSDLNAFTRADNVTGKIGVKWVWDDVNSWTGSGQTGDACALFDTTPSNANKGKGSANFAVCVRITNPGGDPTAVAQLAAPASPLLYSCGDTKADRCASSTKLLPLNGITCEVEKVYGENYFPAGDDSADVVAACSIPFSALSTTSTPNLLNVCSFPSGSPNSNPFDCVVTPGAGFFVIKKATTPQSSGETFSFTISPTPVGGASHSLKDSTSDVEQTSLISASPGTKAYSVGEVSIPSDWSLASAACAFDRSGAPATGTKIGSSVDSVSIESGETTVCTFTNTRNQGSIELKKVWSGTGGQTTLKIGTSSGGSETASQLTGAAGATPLTTGAQSVNTGTYYVSESGGLDDYSSQLACTNKGSAISVGAGNSISVTTGDVVVCTFTNTRNQGSIELKKVWSGTAGQTTLKIGTSSGGSEVASQLTGAAGATPLTTGTKSVNTGTYYVSESGGLTDYSSQLACTSNGNPVTPGAGNSLSVATGDVVVCTFTNTRNQGSIELKKVWSGTGGQTTLKIGTAASGSQVTSQQTGAAGAAPLSTGAQTVNTGTYYVSETGGLTDYSAQLECTSDGNPLTVGTSNSVAVGTNAVVVCTFTNTRNTGSIEVKKVWSGTGGQTTLKIGTSVGGSEVASQLTGTSGGAPLSTGAQGVNTGTFYVSESGGLAAYTPSLACTSNGSPLTPGTGNSISVATGATVVCTFTNTVIPSSITVVKTAGSSTVAETGGSVTYSVVVTNTSPIPVTLTSLIDDKFGDLDGKGTCNGAGNTYGSIAVGGTYSCFFTGTLAASNAEQTHINEVTASVTSDVGPATAKDTAKVTYSDVLPSITVVKSADIDTITANGGLEVSGFTADAIFNRASGGGGGGSTDPIFANNICDDQGANDTPAQSDLNCFSRADNVSGRQWMRWTWDDINSWTGSGQTGDACALLDTNHDGFANFALCARITNPNGDPTQIAQVAGSPILYRCKDAASDRCASKSIEQSIDATTVCTIGLVADQIAGGEDGADVQAVCNLKLSDLGGSINVADISLINVCSFPSGSPSSNPFDCIVSPASGFLVIAKSTTPTNSNAHFAFRLRNSDNTLNATATNGFTNFAVQGGATSAGIPILPGTYAITELLPTNWAQDSVSCTRNGSTITGTLSGTTRLNVPVVQGQTTICTFNNTLSASDTVTFTVEVTNNSAEAVTLFSLEDSENPLAGTPTYSTLNGVGTCTTGGSIAGGQTYTCTFTRVISGSPGFEHKDKVRAVGKDNETNADTKTSSVVTVTIN
ncbi:MAG: hypothetical protein ACM31F_08605 [Gemmatimonas sp.]